MPALRDRQSALVEFVVCALLIGLGLALLQALATVPILRAAEPPPAGGAAQGSLPYERFETNDVCAECHGDFARQHEQALMSQCFTHHWDEIEYFELAAPHADALPKVSGVKAGCNGCHAPLAFLAGDIPPQRPAAGTRANEGVSCDLCHAITGFAGEVPFNFNYVVAPGAAKQGPRAGRESPYHEIAVNPFLRSADFCGVCHNEQDPYGVWVKSTHLEWRDGPHGKAGIACQDCHMPPAAALAAAEGESLPDARQHLFHGAHDEGKLRGAAEVRVHPQEIKVARGGQARLLATVVNAKAGHMLPSGSVEERVVWLEVVARDATGRQWLLPVDPKGFPGEEMTIASAGAMAYQDLGDIKGLDGFAGLKRDGEVPDGCRIFRMPYLDPQGRMTVAQWHTAALGPDYRLAPLRAVNESFTWSVPVDCAPGEVTIVARVWYSRLVSSVAEFMGVPREESQPVLMSEHATRLRVL